MIKLFILSALFFVNSSIAAEYVFQIKKQPVIVQDCDYKTTPIARWWAEYRDSNLPIRIVWTGIFVSKWNEDAVSFANNPVLNGYRYYKGKLIITTPPPIVGNIYEICREKVL